VTQNREAPRRKSMQKYLIIATCLTLLPISSANAQDVKTKGAIIGTSRTHSTDVDPNASKILFTTPEASTGKAFVVTTVCFRLNRGISAGIKIAPGNSENLTCQQFPTGIVLPPDTNVTCNNLTAPINQAFCLVSGVLSKAEFP